MSHWAASYIGTPWVAGETDCWHFARRVWAERFGLDVPAIPADMATPAGRVRAFATVAERGAWREVAQPAEGDAILMGRNRQPCHVGVWVDTEGGGVLHSVEGAGVIFTPPNRLAAMGYRILGRFRRLA